MHTYEVRIAALERVVKDIIVYEAMKQEDPRSYPTFLALIHAHLDRSPESNMSESAFQTGKIANTIHARASDLAIDALILIDDILKADANQATASDGESPDDAVDENAPRIEG